MRGLLASAFILSAASAAWSAEPITTPSGWTITSASIDDSFIDVTCVLTSPLSEKRTKLQLINNYQKDAQLPTRGSALLIVSVPDRLSKADKATIEGADITVAGQFSQTGKAVEWRASGSSGTVRIFIDPKIDTALKPLAKGTELVVTVPAEDGERKSYSVPLTGSAGAIFVYEKCLATVTWRTAPPS